MQHFSKFNPKRFSTVVTVADSLLTESYCSTTIIFAEVTNNFQWKYIDTTSYSNKYNAPSQSNTYMKSVFHFLKRPILFNAYPVITDHCIDFPEETTIMLYVSYWLYTIKLCCIFWIPSLMNTKLSVCDPLHLHKFS